MVQRVFDETSVRDAMRSFLEVAEQLDEASSVGGEPRDLLDLAERKAMAGLLLRKALERHGWTAPAREQSPEDCPTA